VQQEARAAADQARRESQDVREAAARDMHEQAEVEAEKAAERARRDALSGL
jgi:hypothetical protein